MPPNARPPKGPEAVKPDTPLNGAPLGWPESPDDLFVDAEGEPVRIDKGFSWEHPLSAHGLMHNVITNAWRGDPYPIDTLLIFMANMAWNSTMNTSEVRKMLNDKREDGEYKIPFLVVCDAFQSEMTAFADLMLPDTTYLERHDCMSMLDRPISEFDGPVDSVRIPVLPPTGQCKPFQEVLVELAVAAEVPGLRHARRHAQVPRLPRLHRQLRDRAGLGHRLPRRLARQGRREVDARRAEPEAVGDVREEQLRLPPPHAARSTSTCATGTRATWTGRRASGCGATTIPIVIHIYSEFLQRFRLAAQGKRPGQAAAGRACASASRPTSTRCRSTTRRSRSRPPTRTRYPLNAVTQRPMAMYHSWDSQNAWLRQIHTHNYLFVNPQTAQAAGIADGGWMWVESPWGKVRCMCRYSEAVEPGTVWTWNAIGKAAGAWNLSADANESQRGFLLNHLISEELPAPAAARVSNSDPITGQAAWYDVRVRI